MWYSIAAMVPEGQGDYGSNHLTLFDGNATRPDIDFLIAKFERQCYAVKVFRGKSLGKLIYETREINAEDERRLEAGEN